MYSHKVEVLHVVIISAINLVRRAVASSQSSTIGRWTTVAQNKRRHISLHSLIDGKQFCWTKRRTFLKRNNFLKIVWAGSKKQALDLAAFEFNFNLITNSKQTLIFQLSKSICTSLCNLPSKRSKSASIFISKKLR